MRGRARGCGRDWCRGRRSSSSVAHTPRRSWVNATHSCAVKVVIDDDEEEEEEDERKRACGVARGEGARSIDSIRGLSF